MLPFPVTLRPGEPPVHQVAFAATRAILAGVLAPGDRFPSVRELAEALRIHPNTAQKVVAQLQADGLLVVRPGIGTVVADAAPVAPPSASAARAEALAALLEQLVVDGRRLGFDREVLVVALRECWDATFGATVAPSPPTRAAPRTESTDRRPDRPVRRGTA